MTEVNKEAAAVAPVPLFFTVVMSALCSLFVCLSVWLMFVEPGESCNVENITKYRGWMPCISAAVVFLLWVGVRRPRLCFFRHACVRHVAFSSSVPSFLHDMRARELQRPPCLLAAWRDSMVGAEPDLSGNQVRKQGFSMLVLDGE